MEPVVSLQEATNVLHTMEPMLNVEHSLEQVDHAKELPPMLLPPKLVLPELVLMPQQLLRPTKTVQLSKPDV
jgi:hypothetical protein